ncbi:MAG: tetratricopeptide repeat protein [Pyrinomonadaceae bacterium]|nr:tetratricopeptide repeat protein [Pyrinomonadaceae bacterium]
MLLHRHGAKPKLKYLALLLTGFLLSVCATLQAQVGSSDSIGTGGRHSIQGRLVFPSGQRVDIRLKVRLESSGAGDLSVFSDANGQFSFKSLRPGNYTVIVDGGEHYETARESVPIESASISSRRSVAIMPISRPFTVQVYLRPKSQPTDAKIGVLHAALASVPKAAADLYLKALEVAQAGDRKKAIEHLQAALVIHPNFPLALTELGVQYLNTSEPVKAADTLAAAVKLTPDDSPLRQHYGVALLSLRKLAPAEEQFRAALQKSEAPTARMYLGITLAMQRKLAEAEKELVAAVKFNTPEVNLAHRFLGGVYIATREYKRAADELETYLRLAPKAADAAQIRATITDLRNKP